MASGNDELNEAMTSKVMKLSDRCIRINFINLHFLVCPTYINM